MVYKITQSKERPAASLLTMLRLESDFLDSEADKLLNYCLSLQNWERKSLSIFGKNIQLPRLVVAYSDCHQNYAYSRITHKNNPLTQTFNNLLSCRKHPKHGCILEIPTIADCNCLDRSRIDSR